MASVGNAASNSTMPLEICELKELLKSDDKFMTPEEFLELMQSRTEETAQMPEETFQSFTIDTSKIVRHGEITNMLRNTPGILPPVDRLPKQLNGNDDSGIENDKSNGHSTHSDQNGASDISNRSNRSNLRTTIYDFANDDEDPSDGQRDPKPSTHQTQAPEETVKPVQKYYNARQLYEMKRGKKQSKGIDLTPKSVKTLN